jgi:fibronectin-binding autotransporter adhesin
VSTISHYQAFGVGLTNFTTQNPLIITSTGTLAPPGANELGVYGTGSFAWTVVNGGLITAKGSGAVGVYLLGPGSITNQTNGAIRANATSGFGVVFEGGGAVTNQASGSIAASQGIFATQSAASVVNDGNIAGNATNGHGILLQAGGSVTNQTAGTIGGYIGVDIEGAAGTIVNAGTIAANPTTGAGIFLGLGGSITNQSDGSISGVNGIVLGNAAATVINAGHVYGGYDAVVIQAGGMLTNQSGGTIDGTGYGINATGTIALTVTNQGLIVGQAKAGIGLSSGGAVFNQSAGTNEGTIDGADYGVKAPGTIAATVTNQGLIEGQTRAGVVIFGGGTVSNGPSAVIAGGAYGVAATNTAVTVTNQGVIAGSGNSGVLLLAGGYVSNAGTASISGAYFGVRIAGANASVSNFGLIASSATYNGVGGFDAAGVDLADGGTIVNGPSGAISATWKGVEIGAITANVGGTLLNQGVIFASNSSGSTGAAVWIHGPGLISNAATGKIAGGPFGIVAYNQTTVVNLGAISGTEFAFDATPGFADRVVLASGAAFSGLVSGGNTIGASIESTLELASGAGGGTLHALGAKYVDFAAVTVDAGATWTWIADTIGAGYTLSDAGTLTNAGILGSSVTLGAGAVLTNASGGTITSSGTAAVYGSTGAAATVVNAGLIDPATFGVYLSGGGSVTNVSGATIRGTVSGVKIGDGPGTVINAGTISGVDFAGTGSDLLVLDPGAVVGSATANTNSTLELASGTSVGTLSGLGSSFTGFDNIAIDSAARWALAGANTLAGGQVLTNAGSLYLSGASLGGPTLGGTGALQNNGVVEVTGGASDLGWSVGGSGEIELGAGSTLQVAVVGAAQAVGFDTGTPETLILDDIGGFQGTIASFAQGDQIFVNGASVAATGFINNVLTMYAGGGGTIGTVDFAPGAATLEELAPNAQGGVGGPAPCFAAGTRITTEHGDVAIETIGVGEWVRVLLHDRLAPVIWVGRREVDCTRHPQPRKVWPVRVAAGAFGPGRPHSDLFLSPDHAVFLADVLIPVKHLINGSTIAQVPVDRITYHHIELAEHNVLLAEGLPAESFLDMRDGSNYTDRPGPIRLYPDFSVRMWEAFGCARLVVTGSELAAARALVAGFASVQKAA